MTIFDVQLQIAKIREQYLHTFEKEPIFNKCFISHNLWGEIVNSVEQLRYSKSFKENNKVCGIEVILVDAKDIIDFSFKFPSK